jgi:hypothetical protein
MKKPVWTGQTGFLERETGLEPATTCLEASLAFALWHLLDLTGKTAKPPEHKLSS